MLRTLATIFFLSPALAQADQATADACASNLSADAKTIYAAVAADFAAGNGNPDVNARIVALAKAGKIDTSMLRENGKAAAVCLKQWK